MRLKTLFLALAACGVAARFYARSHASGSGSNAGTGLPGTGAESPNTAERLQAQNLAGPQAVTEARTRADDLFASDSQRGPYPEATGLADFSRGA